MKIIKVGDLNRINGFKRFRCPACTCEWEADNSEYSTGHDWRNGLLFTMNCPTCGRPVTVHPEDQEVFA